MLRIFSLIENFITPPQVKHKNGILRLKGGVIGRSDVNGALANYLANRINVYSSSNLLFDQGITRPGASLSFFAPHWQVNGAITIELSGNARAGFERAARAGEGGTGGSHGRPYLGYLGHQESNLPATLNGAPGPNDLNIEGQQNPPLQVPIERELQLQTYKQFYLRSAANPLLSPFVRIFPDL